MGQSSSAQTEPNLQDEIETLKTSLTHALSSEQEMRASARDTREEWERVERALREEIDVLKNSLVDTEEALAKAKKELQGKKVVPFVRRFIRRKGRLAEETITLEEPPQNVCTEVEEECVPSCCRLGPGYSLLHLDPWRVPLKSTSYLMD
jgi:septal ring factor EnvC (AmiA/AmiB activator)